MNSNLGTSPDLLEHLVERIARLEQRLTPIERLFRTATGHDVSLSEDSALLQALIAANPGMSQTGVCLTAHKELDMSRPRVIEVLRRGVGKHRRVEGGMFNALLYFPLENAGCPHTGNQNGQSSPSVNEETKGSLKD